MKKLSRGFTLIELLVVIGILAILLAITLIAINPARQFGQANNTRRRSDVLQILNAIHQYTAENSGILPSEVLALSVTVPTLFDNTGSLVDLCPKLMTNYLPALPVDPETGNANITDCTLSTWNTGYEISRDSENRITVIAPRAALGATIQVTR